MFGRNNHKLFDDNHNLGINSTRMSLADQFTNATHRKKNSGSRQIEIFCFFLTLLNRRL